MYKDITSTLPAEIPQIFQTSLKLLMVYGTITYEHSLFFLMNLILVQFYIENVKCLPMLSCRGEGFTVKSLG